MRSMRNIHACIRQGLRRVAANASITLRDTHFCGRRAPVKWEWHQAQYFLFFSAKRDIDKAVGYDGLYSIIIVSCCPR
jgi:hypothetical protein